MSMQAASFFFMLAGWDILPDGIKEENAMKQHYAPALNRCRKKETLFQINWRARLSAARVIRFTTRPSCGGARLHLQEKCSIIKK